MQAYSCPAPGLEGFEAVKLVQGLLQGLHWTYELLHLVL